MNVMMSLGGFQFSLNTAAYQDLTRSTGYKWGSHDRLGQNPAKQFTGYGDDTMSLQGIVYPEFRGDRFQIENLRDIAKQGQPLLLVSGLGSILGRWVIDKIDEQQSIFAGSGVARKQGFTVSIQYFDEGEEADLLTALEKLTGLLGAGADALSDLDVAKNNADSVLGSATNTASTAISSLNNAMTTLKDAATTAGAVILPVANAVQNGIRLASDVKTTVKQVQGTLKNIHDLPSLCTGLYNVSNAAVRAANAGTKASKLATDLLNVATSPVVANAARSAVSATGNLAVGMGRTFGSVTDVIRGIEA